MKYSIRFARNTDIDNIQQETVHAPDEQTARDMFTCCDCYVYSCETVISDRDNADILRAAHAVGFPNAVIGPQEPPSDYRIFNRRRPDGTFPPLSEFFDEAVRIADAGNEPSTIGESIAVVTGASELTPDGVSSPEWFDGQEEIPF